MKPEQIEQAKLFDWLKSKRRIAPFCFAIMNERRVTPMHGRILRRMGLRSGVSDVFIGVPRGEWHGMFLELKAGINVPTLNQEDFMKDMGSQGYYCVWANGFERAKLCIEEYLCFT